MTSRGDSSDDENEAEEEVQGEDEARLYGGDHKKKAGQETVEGIQTLADSQHVCTVCRIGRWVHACWCGFYDFPALAILETDRFGELGLIELSRP